MWDLPGPGLEPMSPALAGGFLITAAPGKSTHQYFEIIVVIILAPRSLFDVLIKKPPYHYNANAFLNILMTVFKYNWFILNFIMCILIYIIIHIISCLL